MSLYFRESDKRLLLKLFNPLSGWFNCWYNRRLYLRL